MNITNFNLIDKATFILEDITEYEPTGQHHNMVDIQVEDDESFCFADGTVSHNSAIGYLISTRDRELHGGYPLRGKVMNTWGMSAADMLKNKEIFDICAIMGLSIGGSAGEYSSEGKFFTLEDGTIVNENDEILVDGQWKKVKDLL